jgi:hypothetical protein
VELEKLALSTYCPDGVGRWFYERAAGSYNVMLAREGTTPAKLRQLKEAIPPGRKITKTDLAKYLNAWEQKPHLVSLGSQKNFEQFMHNFTDADSQATAPLPDVSSYKRMIAKAILFKTTQKLVRPMFTAFQANVAAYVVSVVANRLGDRLDLDRIWLSQGISPRLQEQIQVWARKVNDVLHQSSGGRMISEWAKKPECWDTVGGCSYSAPLSGISELR